MKKRVLVFPCGSEIGLELHRSLAYSTHVELVGASSVDDHGRFVYQTYVDGLPMVDDSHFLEVLNKVIADNAIDFVYPAHDSVVLRLAEAEAAGELACSVLTSPVDTCRLARSKARTYAELQDIVPVPTVFETVEEASLHLPVFLKPDVGQGSRGTYKANTREEIDFYMSKDASLLMLEYLPGEEYTIDCFTDVSGVLLYAGARSRSRVAGGISVHSEAISDPVYMDYAKKINAAVAFRGAWFFQLKKRASGELALLEIAPRIAGTMGLTRCLGVNLPLLTVFDRMGYTLSVSANSYAIQVDRALQSKYKLDVHYTKVYLDFDDTVLFEGRVNPLVIAFVYQCINEKIPVILITKHKDVLAHTLQKYRLAGLFDQEILLQKEQRKCDFMQPDGAIFIDDSFAERAQVAEELHIPTFDVHMLESLMD